MAMFHAQPLLLLLIVSLLFLPAALGATKFRKCNPDRNSPVEVKTLTISPEPPVESSTNGNITVIGDSSIEISDGATVSIIVAPKRSDRRSYSLCDLVACPVAPGPIEFTVPNVFTKEELDVDTNEIRSIGTRGTNSVVGQTVLLAFRLTPYGLCGSTGTFDYPVVVNTVEISPDTITSSTNANITITGVTNLSKDSSKGSLSRQDLGGSSISSLSKGKQIFQGHREVFTHFISLPLATHSKLQDEVKGFQASVVNMGFHESLLVSPSKLHLTVVMLNLKDVKDLDKAKRVLKDISKNVNDALDNRPVAIRLRGLECMEESLDKTRVLYAPVEEVGKEGRLLRACHVMIDAFVPDKLAAEKEKSRLKLHLTMMSKGETFDAREIQRVFREKDWGEYKIEKADISQRIWGFSNVYYPSHGSLTFPA
ncbi:hypothetical protein Bca52824_041304 [Brassica carinata]|uniref:Protein kinase A anchor protein nuclear localisation signal domain-containing protein n=1 Tax=Brassica carinata TaxID=52824 RepID=A0A8X7RUM3_BRACI|nr:hypothetical protein Bca52824_041304 [Brassica carinata]